MANGTVYTSYQEMVTIKCILDVTEFPFGWSRTRRPAKRCYCNADKQTCNQTFVSWTYPLWEVSRATLVASVVAHAVRSARACPQTPLQPGTLSLDHMGVGH